MPPDAREQDEPQLRFVEAAPTTPAPGTDVVQAGPHLALLGRIAPRAWLIAAVLAALAIGLGTGYAVGRHNAPTRPVPFTPTPSRGSAAKSAPFGPVEALALTGARCAAQHGRQIALGVEVINNASTPVRLLRTISHQPLGGLGPIGSIRGTCSEIGPVTAQDVEGYELRPGSTVWLTLTFQVLVRCPEPLPVQIDVDYLRDGSPHHVDLGGFADLGGVPYSGCQSG